MNKKIKKEEFLRKGIVVWIGALICCVLWGSAFPCIKIGYRMFGISSGDTATQILFAGMRFTLAGILTVLIGSAMGRRLLAPKKASLPRILWLSMLQTVLQYIFFYVGLAHTSGVKASVISAVSVFIAIIVASLIFHQEKLTPNKIFGCFIGFIGVVLVNLTGSGLDLKMSLTGEGFILFSSTAYAFSSVFMKKYSKEENPVVLSGYQFLNGGIIMMLIGILFGGRVTGFTIQASAMLLYLAFISAVAYTLWGILLKYNPISRVAVFGFMNPVFGFILSAVLLDEGRQALGIKSVAALFLVCIGIYIVNRNKKSAK